MKICGDVDYLYIYIFGDDAQVDKGCGDEACGDQGDESCGDEDCGGDEACRDCEDEWDICAGSQAVERRRSPLAPAGKQRRLTHLAQLAVHHHIFTF